MPKSLQFEAAGHQRQGGVPGCQRVSPPGVNGTRRTHGEAFVGSSRKTLRGRGRSCFASVGDR